MTEKDEKHYSAREERCSAIIHGAGILFFLIALFPLLAKTKAKGDLLYLAGVIDYSLSLLLLFSASTVYHLLPQGKGKAAARKADHCAIYFLISGTYAPIMLGTVKNATGYGICIALFLLTVLGTVGKFCFAQKFHRLEIILYLLMGWCCLLVARPLAQKLSLPGGILLLAGGAAYTLGVIFYLGKKEFSHALWHLFVLAGAVLQFAAVFTV